jgi:hypothetical protein
VRRQQAEYLESDGNRIDGDVDAAMVVSERIKRIETKYAATVNRHEPRKLQTKASNKHFRLLIKLVKAEDSAKKAYAAAKRPEVKLNP